MARTEWVLNDTGINIKWITQFYGNASETINIKWTDIEKYREINGKGYNVFKIYLVDGSIVEFGHAGLFVVDDFDKFYEQFQEMFIKNKHPE